MKEWTPCAVPGCKRQIGTRAALKRFGFVPHQWLCETHWRRVPKTLKRCHARHLRRERKLGFDPLPVASERVWRWCMRAASSA